MTGQPLSETLRNQAVSNNELSKVELIKTIVKSDAFLKHFARFWSSKIGVNNIANGGIYQMRKRNSGETLKGKLQGKVKAHAFSANGVKQPTQDTINVWINEIKNRSGRLHIRHKECSGFTLLRHLTVEHQHLNKILKTGKYLDGSTLKAPLNSYNALNVEAKKAYPGCDNSDLHEEIKPYWDPKGKYKWRVAKYLRADSRWNMDNL